MRALLCGQVAAGVLGDIEDLLRLERLSRAARKAFEAKQIFDVADDAGRDLTAEERAHVAELLEGANVDRELETKMAVLGGKLGAPELVPESPFALNTLSPGERFVRSEGYRGIKSAEGRSAEWSTGAISVGTGGMQMKGTLLETGAGGPGGGLVPAQYAPGIVSTLFQPLVLGDVLPSVQATGSQIRYVVEGTATSGAAGVAEGGTKPESTLGYSEVTEPVRKIATMLPVSDELLEDAPAIQQYVNTRLSLFVRIEEERQLLRGAGGNELTGIFARSISTTSAGTTNADRIFRAAAGVRGSAFLDPDFVVVHPSNWTTMRLQQDGAGQYFGGGPWGGQYGATTAGAQTSSFSSSPYWGMRVLVSTTVGAGTALVGSSQGAAVWRRGGLTVEATNSHSNWFQLNLNAIRAEERLALACYRPSAFCAVTGLT